LINLKVKHCQSYLIGQEYCWRKPTGSIGSLNTKLSYNICTKCYRKIFENTQLPITEEEEREYKDMLQSIIDEIQYYCPKGLLDGEREKGREK